MTKYAHLLANTAIALLFSEEFQYRHRVSPRCFTRRRRMSFSEVMGALLNFFRKSSQLEIDSFMELLDPLTEKPVTKQAFSKARLKIMPRAFKELLESGVMSAFANDMFKRLKGWRIFAVDGTELQLPRHGNNLPDYQHNSAHSLPHARASILCDVLSGFIVHAAIDTTATGERDMAMEHIASFIPFKAAKDLVIFDRGYPSKEFVKYLNDHCIKYLMRVPKGFNADADASSGSDFSIQVHGCHVRAVKVPLPSGETELLFANLSRDEFKTKEFAALYHLRWGAEVKYNALKNKLDIESFSGRSLHTVLQDFWATLFLSNMAAGVKRDADSAIEKAAAAKKESGKPLKYEEYRANENLMIGRLKNNLIMIFFEKDAAKRALLFQKLVERISAHYVPVIPGRSFPRRPDSHKRIANRQRKAL